MKKPKLSILVLYGVCAFVWTIRAVLGVIYREYASSPVLFALNGICALIWIVAFVRWLVLYLSDKAERERYEWKKD